MKKKLNEKLFTYRIAVDRFMFKDGALLYRSSGKQAGSLSANGYRIVSVRLGGVDRAYLVHRVIRRVLPDAYMSTELVNNTGE